MFTAVFLIVLPGRGDSRAGVSSLFTAELTFVSRILSKMFVLKLYIFITVSGEKTAELLLLCSLLLLLLSSSHSSVKQQQKSGKTLGNELKSINDLQVLPQDVNVCDVKCL